MLFQKRQPPGQGPQPILGGIDPLPESLILGFELDDPLPGLIELGAGKHPSVDSRLLQLTFGLQSAPPPTRQLLGEMVHDALELSEGLLIGTFVVV
jgi:hypothetical protein